MTDDKFRSPLPCLSLALLASFPACRTADVPSAADPALPVSPCPRVARLIEAATGNAPRQPTEVRILCGPAKLKLYIGFRYVDDHAWGTKTARDADIYNEECVEVFISPAGTAHQHYEINVSPTKRRMGLRGAKTPSRFLRDLRALRG